MLSLAICIAVARIAKVEYDIKTIQKSLQQSEQQPDQQKTPQARSG